MHCRRCTEAYRFVSFPCFQHTCSRVQNHEQSSSAKLSKVRSGTVKNFSKHVPLGVCCRFGCLPLTIQTASVAIKSHNVAKRTQQQKHLQFVWSADGKAIFASGVGQPDVKHGSGTIASRQANNMLIYPGLSPYNFPVCISNMLALLLSTHRTHFAVQQSNVVTEGVIQDLVVLENHIRH